MSVRPLAVTVFFLGLLASPIAAQRIKLPVKLSELEARALADSNDAAAHYNVALGYWSKKRYDDAEAALRRAVAVDPRFAEAYLALAYLPYARRSQLWEEIAENRVPEHWQPIVEEAERQYRRAFLINPLVDLKIIGAVTPGKSVVWQTNAALRAIYDKFFRGFDDVFEGKYERAYGRLAQLIHEMGGGRHPERIPEFLLWYRAIAAAHIERYDDAIEDMQTLLDRSLDEESKDSLIYVPLQTNEYRYVLAALKHQAGQLDEAVPLYREALENDLGLYMAHVQLARIHQAQGDWSAAIAECRRAVDANPEDPSLVFDLGVALTRAGALPDAEAVLLEAEGANPRDARVPYILGLVQLGLKKPDAARASFTRFLSMAPSRFEAQMADARERLASLP